MNFRWIAAMTAGGSLLLLAGASQLRAADAQAPEAAPPLVNPEWIKQAAKSFAVKPPPPVPTTDEPSPTGPFKASWDSLETQYQAPEWFRDAKFGIWAHWTAQCVPEQGDWYARRMYMQGDSAYHYQVTHYGHPSKIGFKDIDLIWHAERWNPEELIKLYKAAGAKYFVALANHHDNFDCWNSKYQPWNSVNIGPHKDIVGTWARIARANGLHFGVTVHAARSWDWFDVAHGSDKTGPLAGVPYDGHLTAADGKGQWWDGYDPADLYSPDGAARTQEAHAAYERKFYNRVMDLLNSYHPDLLYFDDGEPPTSYGLQIAANFYNASKDWHNGDLQAVLNVKGGEERVKKSMILDYERGRSSEIAAEPWQTDTCIGDWHYNIAILKNHSYKTADQVVKMLADIVSKNGNLLLNIPLPGSGQPDADEMKFLHQMADWMKVNSESIFSTRPWKLSGEGPTKIRGGGFSEGGEQRLGPGDFRFTTKGNDLYAISMGWPESGQYTVHTLAANAPGIVGTITDVSLLGSKQKLKWSLDQDGLEVTLPERKPCDFAYALKITGLDLAASTPVAPVVPEPLIKIGRDGSLTLRAVDADLKGKVQVQSGTLTNIGFWDNPSDTVSWKVDFPTAGIYDLTAQVAAQNDPTTFVVDAGSGPAPGIQAPITGDWNKFITVTGTGLKVDNAGPATVTVHAADPQNWHPMNLASVKLKLSK